MLAVCSCLNDHAFARQCERHEDRPMRSFGHAIALGAQPDNLNVKRHVAPLSGTRYCRCRLQWAIE